MNNANRNGCEFCEQRQAMRSAVPYSDRQVVTMAYVPMQTDTAVYEVCKALRQGTLFPVLDKPFMRGCRA